MAPVVGAAEDPQPWQEEGEALLEKRARAQDRVLGKGRGAARAITLEDGSHGVWRINRHGGMLGGLQGARYPDAKRLQQEVILSEALRSMGVRTPRVLLALALRRGMGWRQHLVTEEVEGATTVYAAREEAESLVGAGKLLEQVFELGLWATDLHPGNLLWRAEDRSCWLIDLAGARLLPKPLDRKQRAQRGERFLRYYRKHAGVEPEGADRLRRELWQG
jgi:hypothetical protein